MFQKQKQTLTNTENWSLLGHWWLVCYLCSDGSHTLGLILVEKEETLALASSRMRSTFVSKFIKTETEKEVGKARGRQVLRTNKQTKKRREAETQQTYCTMQQGDHFGGPRTVSRWPVTHPLAKGYLDVFFNGE